MRMKISFIGAGNLATHLAIEFYSRGFEIIQIFSRNIANAKVLAQALNASYTDDLSQIYENADLYFVSVTDDSILQVIENLCFKPKFIVHTSGSISMEIFTKRFENYGVFYPLQTFSKMKKVEFENIPICLDANNLENLDYLTYLAKKISNSVFFIDSNQRKQIHLAGVFACNFVNHLWVIANEILEKQSIPFEIIKPLIQETFHKAFLLSPASVQTGPAMRNDEKVIQEHIKLLEHDKNSSDIYKILTKSIQTYKK